jgi:outer membrane protein OmpA-like peptidoglycan-associated protein/opacity protein-like surface antigen
MKPITIYCLSLLAVVLLGGQPPAQAQTQTDVIEYTKPSWFFGVAGGGNFNYYRGTTQELQAGRIVPKAFHNGNGLGLFVAPLIEFRPATSNWGLMLQAGYDNRSGAWDQVTTPCLRPADLSTNLSYWTIEPSLRLAPFKSNFYLYAGPRFAFNNTKAFTYQMGIDPTVVGQVPVAEENGDFAAIRSNLISWQVGAGLDIPLTSNTHQTQWVLSPFASFQPYYGQDPRTIESLNITTIRVGAALKLGRGRRIEKSVMASQIVAPVAAVVKKAAAVPDINFVVKSPTNIASESRVNEMYPLRNYVFFDKGSSTIPSRYVLLKKKDVPTFKEEDLKMTTPADGSGRSERQMDIYYNILNILGNRMSTDKTATVLLVGSSLDSDQDGLDMAQSVKTYLVTVFDIAPERITVQGRNRPVVPSGYSNGTKEVVMVNEGDRRVSIESNSPSLLKQFQSEQTVGLIAPLDSYVTFSVGKNYKELKTWSMEITDEAGKVQFFGPYTQESVSLSGNALLGDKANGNFKVRMFATSTSNVTIEKNANMHVNQWKSSNETDGNRYSIIFGFDQAEAQPMYRTHLLDVVVPRIPRNGTVVIQGFTDIIGSETYNQKLSMDRANNVKSILEEGLKKAGRTDVKFVVSGKGENANTAQFKNTYPEERFYNRTVIIDLQQK